jgi:hypothetical protein
LLTLLLFAPAAQLRELDTPEGDVPAFLAAAATTLNDACWVRCDALDATRCVLSSRPGVLAQGTLSCSVFIHPATERAHAAAFDRHALATHACCPRAVTPSNSQVPSKTAFLENCGMAASA